MKYKLHGIVTVLNLFKHSNLFTHEDKKKNKKKKSTSNLHQENAWQCTSLELTPKKKKGKGKEKTQHD